MNILLVAPCFPPQHTVASRRTHSFAKAWSAAGHTVTVLTTRKREDQCGLDLPCDTFTVVEIDYSAPWLFERMRGKDKAQPTSKSPGWSYLSALRWLKQKTGIFSSVRMPDLTDYWVEPALAWARSQGSWDVVVSSSGPYTANLVARAIKRERIASRWVADFRDLWTDNHISCGLFPFTLKEHWLEKACLREADLVVTVTPGLARRLQAKTATPVEVIYNGYDADATRTISLKPAFPADGRLRIVYTGTLYPQGQDPRSFLEGLSMLERESPDLAGRLAVVIAGPSFAVWQRFVAVYPLSCVEVRAMASPEDALRMQRDADALLLVDWHDPREGVLTGKVFEYFQACAPIFLVGSPNDSPLVDFVTRTGRGLVLPGTADSLKDWLKRWLADPASVRMKPDLALIGGLTRSRQAARLLELIGTETKRVAA